MQAEADQQQAAQLAGGPCRLCLRACGQEPLRPWALFDSELPQKLMAFAAVQIHENDGLPAVVCTNCRDLVYISYEFKCQVEKSDHDLRQALLTKQSTLNTEWPTVPIAKPHENASAPVGAVIPSLQNNILHSCMTIQDDYAANNHEQFAFKITSDPMESEPGKKDMMQQNNPIGPQSVITNNLLSFSMDNVIGPDQSSPQNDIVHFQVQYPIERDFNIGSDCSKLEANNTRENSNQSDDEKPLILRTKRHKCNYCIKSFANLALLEKHAVIHRQNKIYICYICEEQFESLEKVKNHVIEVHKVIQGKLLEGGRIRDLTESTESSAGQECDLLVGRPDEKSETKYTCKLCSRIFTSHKLYLSHNKCHKYKQPNNSSSNKNSLAGEAASHPSNTGAVDSSAVQASYVTNSESASHPADLKIAAYPVNAEVSSESGHSSASSGGSAAAGLSSGNDAGKSKNRDCGGDVDDNGNDDSDEDDERSHSENDSPLGANIQCNVCGKLVATQSNLKRHLLIHSGLRFDCSVCDKNFSRQDRLKEHQLKHGPELCKLDSDTDCSNEKKAGAKKKKTKNNRPYKCPLCPKAFAQPQSLANHEERHKRVREVGKRFLCEVCSKCFAQSGSLVAHMRTHTGVKPYVCNICSRAFTKSTYLQLHLRTHSGEKPYVCQYCNKAFARANTLARHITMHTGEAKYQCQICSKMFRRLTSLNEHMYTHTGQRPYACKICSKRYNNAGSLYAHTKKCKSALEASANCASAADGQLGDSLLQMPDSTTMIPAIDAGTVPPQILIFTEKKLDDAISDEALLAEAQTCQFMIANMHSDRPVLTSMLDQFAIQDPDIFNINSRQYKMPYYGLYPGM